MMVTGTPLASAKVPQMKRRWASSSSVAKPL